MTRVVKVVTIAVVLTSVLALYNILQSQTLDSFRRYLKTFQSAYPAP